MLFAIQQDRQDTQESEEIWFFCQDCDPVTVFPLPKEAMKKCEKSLTHTTIKKINPVNNVNVRIENITKDRYYVF